MQAPSCRLRTCRLARCECPRKRQAHAAPPPRLLLRPGARRQAATKPLRPPTPAQWDDYVLLSRRAAHPTLCFLPMLSPLTSRTVLTWKTFITVFDMT
jgi:hypothetical protein